MGVVQKEDLTNSILFRALSSLARWTDCSEFNTNRKTHVIKYVPVHGIAYLVLFHRELDETLDYSRGLVRSRSKQMEKNEESRCRRSDGTDGCGSSRP